MQRIIIISAAVAFTWNWSGPNAQAGIWNRLGRCLGLGWSDGYHSRPVAHPGPMVVTPHWQGHSQQYHVPYSSRVQGTPEILPSAVAPTTIVPGSPTYRPTLNYRQTLPSDSVLQHRSVGPTRSYQPNR